MTILESAEAIGHVLGGQRYIDAEFMYRSRPTGERERAVFDYALFSRLSQLESTNAVLFICDSTATIDSLQYLEKQFPHLRIVTAIANPMPWAGTTPDTPRSLNWENSDEWRRYQTTDRWARINFALQVASAINKDGYLIMPAHDAVCGRGLLERLRDFSEKYARGGLPAAVSPYTYYQHSAVPDVDIPADIINTLNTAFSRDTMFPWKLRFDHAQAFWGKMGMIPFAMCGAVREKVETFVWEDDLEIDRAIRESGYGVRCWYVRNPALYRQALPVFDRNGLKKVIERTLHYSLNIPGQTIGSSSLNFPLGALGRLRALLNPRFAHYNTLAEALIAECMDMIRARLEQYGASWVDWGVYRHVIRIGDPAVEVWKPGTVLV
jgi:hypothetical protein